MVAVSVGAGSWSATCGGSARGMSWHFVAQFKRLRVTSLVLRCSTWGTGYDDCRRVRCDGLRLWIRVASGKSRVAAERTSTASTTVIESQSVKIPTRVSIDLKDVDRWRAFLPGNGRRTGILFRVRASGAYDCAVANDRPSALAIGGDAGCVGAGEVGRWRWGHAVPRCSSRRVMDVER